MFDEWMIKKDDQHALSFLKEGDSIEKVARCMELPIEHVKKLAEQLEKCTSDVSL